MRIDADPELMEVARQIGPLIREHNEEAEGERRLSKPVLAALHETGLLRMVTPRSLGGLEVDPITRARVIEEIAGYDTADAAFNQGNALVMLGKYVEAAERYARALELRPDWEAANVNREIALGRAEALKKEGGDMTGGEMGADEIVFTEGKAPPSAGEEQIEDGQQVSDAEVRAVWLRQVQTKPADFLRAKFAYQYATRETRDD